MCHPRSREQSKNPTCFGCVVRNRTWNLSCRAFSSSLWTWPVVTFSARSNLASAEDQCTNCGALVLSSSPFMFPRCELPVQGLPYRSISLCSIWQESSWETHLIEGHQCTCMYAHKISNNALAYNRALNKTLVRKNATADFIPALSPAVSEKRDGC